jgi:hypothetical protein
MMNTFLKILQIVPDLLMIVAAIEKFFPESGAGKEKLEMLRRIMSEAYTELSELWPVIEKIVSVIVEFANGLGTFKKSV